MSGGRHIAILIGNSEFSKDPSLSALRCPQRDVEGLAAALTARETGLFADPLIFINEPHHKALPAINRVFKQAGRHDQILIYYSGHGKQDNTGSLHLATADTEVDALETTSIAVDSFRRLIDNHACKQVALILDCCFGGAAGKDFLKGGVDDQLQQVGRGIYVLTASTATQTAREKDGDEYSLLTKHILHGIVYGEADQDDDGLVSLDDLYEYVRARVPREAPQYPMKWALGIQGGEFVIARAVKIYSPEQLDAVHELINSLYKYLPPDISDQAIQVIRAKQPKQDKEFLSLIEALNEKRVNVGEFVSRWIKLGLPFSVQQQRELVAREQRELEERRQRELVKKRELGIAEKREAFRKAQEQRELKEKRKGKLEEQRESDRKAQREAARQAEERWKQEAQLQHDKRYLFDSHDARPVHPQNSTADPARNHPASKADELALNADGSQPFSTNGRSRKNLFILAGLIAIIIGGLAVGVNIYVKRLAQALEARQQALNKDELLSRKDGQIGSLREKIAELSKRLEASDPSVEKEKKRDISEKLSRLSQRLDEISKMSPEQSREISQGCDDIGKECNKIEEVINSMRG